jgi:hypothetical protein
MFSQEEMLVRKLNYLLRAPAKLVVVWALVGLVGLSLSGCSLGPINIGDNGTPVPTGTPPSTVPPPTPTQVTRSLQGKVLDAYTDKPIPDAQVMAGDILTETTSAGVFSFDTVPLVLKVSAVADGYAPAEMESKDNAEVTIKLRPTTLSGKVTDATTGKPLAEVLVKLVLPAAEPAAPATPLTSSVPSTATVLPAATVTTSSLNINLGKVLAAPLAAGTPTTEKEAATPTEAPPAATPTNTPMPPLVPPTGPGFVAVYTDVGGNYQFKDVPLGSTLTFKMPGYKLTKMPVENALKKDMALEQFKAEAMYVTANYASSPDLFEPLLEFATKSRINSIVLNVQDDASAWVFDVKNKDAIAADNTDIFVPQMPELVKKLKDKGFYTIARVVTFQQKKMAEARPDWAVKSSTSGKPWKGGYAAQQRWLDASNPAAQDHIIEMTKEVLALGFDEIQYDYIRFPSDPAPSESGDMVFSGGPLTDTGKVLALQSFFKKAHDLIEPTDAFMSADVFGYTLWPDRDGEPILGVIGQVPRYLMPYTDYLCPMIYPSHFSPGEQGCAKPAQCAYKLVHKSGEYAQKIFEGQRAKYRPWLQDFDWPGADYTSPGTTKVTEQLQAARETGAWGWQWWDAANEYQPRAAFRK